MCENGKAASACGVDEGGGCGGDGKALKAKLGRDPGALPLQFLLQQTPRADRWKLPAGVDKSCTAHPPSHCIIFQLTLKRKNENACLPSGYFFIAYTDQFFLTRLSTMSFKLGWKTLLLLLPYAFL